MEVSRNYDKLTSAERFALTLAAMARDDRKELARLRDACPRRLFKMLDSAWTSRMESSFHVAGAAFIDLNAQQVKLDLLRELCELMPGWMEWPGAIAQLAFNEGHYSAWAAVTNAPEGATEPPEDSAATRAATQHVIATAERLAGLPGMKIAELAAGAAVDLLSLWEGFTRFTRLHMELEPLQLLQAWGYPTEALVKSLAIASKFEVPDASCAAKYAAILSEGWISRHPKPAN